MSASRPRFVFDGDCGFCRGWVRRWQAVLGERVEFRPFQEVAEEHPEIAREEFRARSTFFDADGVAYGGAEAVLRALALVPGKRWMLWAYLRIPGWRQAAEALYGTVARRRMAASRIQRWLVGADVTPSGWRLSRRLFLAALGLVYLIAFGSLWWQLAGLFGSRGIAPLAETLARMRETTGEARWVTFPSVFWLGATDASLHLVAGAGVVLSILLVLGFAPRVVAALLWGAYLSFVAIGYPFLSFQWDVLLLETGLLASLYAPAGWRPFGAREPAPSAGLRFLLRWLLFRLMFLSGAVKLASGDDTWWDLTALEVHFWTQPLPHRLSHYAHHLPEGLLRASTAVMFAIELGLPFLVFGPRRLRHVACGGFVLLMVLIAATGNYGFFNLLTIVLCIPLLDDRVLRWLLRSSRLVSVGVSRARGTARRVLLAGFVLAVFALTAAHGARRLGWVRAMPEVLVPLERSAAGLRSFNSYGLFADMTDRRPEIIVEVSLDGAEWRACRFFWKPGAVRRVPGFAGPYMPRLDWQMWFAALRGRPEPWFRGFVARVLEGSEPVLGLLEVDPLGGERPRFVRATLYEYRFGSGADRAEGIWWRRRRLGPFGPVWGLTREGVLRAIR